MDSVMAFLVDIRPLVPTYAGILAAALLPIYTGTHASLSRPSSAAKPREGEKIQDERLHRMEGMSGWDAAIYPVMAGSTLVGLYFLIKWLEDPDLLNKIINGYLSIFGALAVARLLSDSIGLVLSFIFPARYSDRETIWELDETHQIVRSQAKDGELRSTDSRRSPLPGRFGRMNLGPSITSALWITRSFLKDPLTEIHGHLRGLSEKTTITLGAKGIVSVILATVAVIYFNFIGKPWYLVNLFGISFCYTALQLMSPTTFLTGTLLLAGLFFYDIYFVFYTPMMITVAKKLDVPVKLLIPRPTDARDDPTRKAMSMLGLGDIVLPGIMIGLALRFDLYLHYLKQTKRRNLSSSESTDETCKPTYRRAAGSWGERFWLGDLGRRDLPGWLFPKTYFRASMIGYILGMLATLGFMHYFKHGQPALLYLVPSVLLFIWGTALARGEVSEMWKYDESEEEEKEEKLEKKKKTDEEKGRHEGNGNVAAPRINADEDKAVQATGSGSAHHATSRPVNGGQREEVEEEKENAKLSKKQTGLFSLRFRRARKENSQKDISNSRERSSSDSSTNSAGSGSYAVSGELREPGEPVGKRRRLQ